MKRKGSQGEEKPDEFLIARAALACDGHEGPSGRSQLPGPQTRGSHSVVHLYGPVWPGQALAEAPARQSMICPPLREHSVLGVYQMEVAGVRVARGSLHPQVCGGGWLA